MAIVDEIPDIGLPSISKLGTILLWFLGIIIVAGIIAWITYIIIMRRRYKYRIRVYKTVSGKAYEFPETKAMEKKLGVTGDSVLFIKKPKKYLPLPQIQAGHNLFYFYIKEDGDWINIGLEELNEKLRELKIHFVDADMRYSRAALQKHFKEEFSNIGWFQKNAAMLVNIAVFDSFGLIFLFT